MTAPPGLFSYVRWLVGRAVAICCALNMATGYASTPITVTDDVGQSVTFEKPPARIITLLPSLTETVCMIGACDHLVGTDRYSNWPDRVNALPKLGGMEGVSIELILALKPDVILLSHSSRISQRLKELGVPVLELDTTSLEGTHHLLNTVGTLVAKPEVANQVWAGILAQINEANQKIPRSLKGKTVYWEVSSAPFAAGESSFIGELLMGFGLKNIVDRRLGPFPKLNPEYIVRADPDILMGAQSDFANLSDRPGFNSLHALMQHNLCAFTPNEISLINRPGPRVGESALVIADCLNQLDSHFNKQVNRGH